MTKSERIRELKKEFKRSFEKLERIINTTNRDNGLEEVINVIQISYFIYHRINDNLKIVNKI